MAIEKHTINANDPWQSLFGILQNNASDYFDTIEIDSNENITCKVSTNTALKINNGDNQNSGLYYFYLKNGTMGKIGGLTPSYVVVTSKGILIHSNVNNYIPTDFFICKTNNGDLAFCILGSYYQTYYYKGFWVVDYENTDNIGYYVHNRDNDNTVWPAITFVWGDNVIKKTTFTPIPCNQAVSHLDGIYQLTYNQYYNVYGEITDGEGNSYFSNGCLAIAD